MFGIPMKQVQMASQGYKRTNFEEDDYASNGGTPTSVDFPPGSVVFKGQMSLPSWKRRTMQEKVLLLQVAVLVLIVIIMAAVLAYKDKKIDGLVEKNERYCTTPACIKVSSTMMTSMNATVDPCKDFFQYACGGWIKNNPIPSGHSQWGVFDVMGQRNLLIMKNAIEKPLTEFSNEAGRKVKKFYDSCMDKDKLIEKAGGEPLLKLIDDLNWGFQWDEWDYGWQLPADWNINKMIEDVHLMSISAFFSIWVSEDDKNSSANILTIDEGRLGLLNRDNYLMNKTVDDDKLLGAYLTYMKDLFRLLGAPNDTFTDEQMREVILFETELARITLPEEEKRDEEERYTKVDLSYMSRTYPQIQWIHLVKHLLSKVGVSVEPTESVVVYASEYLTSLDTIMIKYLANEEGKMILNNYMLWHVVKMFSGLLSKPFMLAKEEITQVMTGRTGNDDKWHICISEIASDVLGFAVGALFAKDVFQDDSKKEAEDMINNVRHAFISNLPNLDWMDDETRQAAIEKAIAVFSMIGYPEYIMNDDKLDKKYQRLKVNESDYFGNNLGALHFSFIQSFERIHKPPQKTEWDMSPATVNAYYTANHNTIVFPAGILQAPFFSRDHPESLNYGAIGVVMGHELTHGFDDQGRKFDKNGNLKPWWNKKAVERFKDKAQCMLDQYSSYSINGEKIRGKQNLGENIADNGGLKSAFHAYKKWTKSHAKEKLLPGLELSHEQLFFLSFAQVWCLNSRPEMIHLQIQSDPHSPDEYRVIGSLSNSKNFARAYKCSTKSRMNPETKCSIW